MYHAISLSKKLRAVCPCIHILSFQSQDRKVEVQPLPHRPFLFQKWEISFVRLSAGTIETFFVLLHPVTTLTAVTAAPILESQFADHNRFFFSYLTAGCLLADDFGCGSLYLPLHVDDFSVSYLAIPLNFCGNSS